MFKFFNLIFKLYFISDLLQLIVLFLVLFNKSYTMYCLER